MNNASLQGLVMQELEERLEKPFSFSQVAAKNLMGPIGIH